MTISNYLFVYHRIFLESHLEKLRLLEASCLALCAFFFVAVFGIFLKIAGETTPVVQVTFVAFVSAFILRTATMGKEIFSLHTKRIGTHFFRGFFGVIATLLYIWALKTIPVIDATLLFNTTPLFIPLLSIVLFRKKISSLVWLSVVVGFIGVLFILRPLGGFSNNFGNLLGLGSGLFLALAFLIVKLLTSTEPSARIIFYFFFFGSILMIPLLLLYPHFPDARGLLFSCLAGVPLLLVQIFLVKAYSIADPHDVGALQYTSVVFAGIFDWILWGRTPSLLTYIGIALVVIGGSLVVILYDRKNRSKKTR